jgi:hypothetical protein
VIRDPGSRDTPGIAIVSCDNGDDRGEIKAHDNLIYGGERSPGDLAYGGIDATGIVVGRNTGTTAFLYKNSIYANATGKLILSTNAQPSNGDLVWRNNILHQAGSADSVGFSGYADWSTHDHNVYYAPDGSAGVTLNSTEINADPHWQAIPEGPYSSSGAALMADSPAIDAGGGLSVQGFEMDLAGVSRPQGPAWDIGAYEFVPAMMVRSSPGDRAIRLQWTLHATDTVESWRSDYYTQTATAPFTATDPLSTTRSYVLTENVHNYQWYTVTLHAMVGEVFWLSDTVRVMPTDKLVYLPLILRTY